MLEFVRNAPNYLKIISFVDVLDILLVAYLLYQGMRLVRHTSVEMVIKGIFVFVILLWVSDWFGLNVIHFVLKNMMQMGLVAIVIMFQPELRKMLEQVGRSSLPQLFSREAEQGDIPRMIREVVDACSSMSWSRTGALIVFERRDMVEKSVTAGTQIDAVATSELIKNIFYTKAPLHDGAMIIAGGRIRAAGCVLPLSEDENLSKELGMRHRAGIGMTEASDALVVVVSEESGSISVAQGGVIKRNLAPEALENILRRELIAPENEEDRRKKVFSFWKGRAK